MWHLILKFEVMSSIPTNMSMYSPFALSSPFPCPHINILLNLWIYKQKNTKTKKYGYLPLLFLVVIYTSQVVLICNIPVNLWIHKLLSTPFSLVLICNIPLNLRIHKQRNMGVHPYTNRGRMQKVPLLVYSFWKPLANTLTQICAVLRNMDANMDATPSHKYMHPFKIWMQHPFWNMPLKYVCNTLTKYSHEASWAYTLTKYSHLRGPFER